MMIGLIIYAAVSVVGLTGVLAVAAAAKRPMPAFEAGRNTTSHDTEVVTAAGVAALAGM